MKKAKKTKNIIILTGGTGGHIFPARCIAQELVKKGFHPHIIANKNYLRYISYKDQFDFNLIAATSIKKSLFSLFFGAFTIFFGIIKSLLIILLKNPKVIIAFGGYATFPSLIAAVILRKNIIIHEQNAHLGKVNQIFAKFANKIALSFKNTSGIAREFQEKSVYTGNPIRSEIIKLFQSDYQYPNYNVKYKSSKNMGYDLVLSSDFDEIKKVELEYFNILIIGGSGGAKIFSDILPKAFFNVRSELKSKINITQQCRQDIVEETFEQYKTFNLNITVKPFFNNIEKKIKEAHLVIARAGSSTIFELAAAKKPMILVPFAKSAHDHQQKNADQFLKKGAAYIVKEKDFTINNITNITEKLIDNPKLLYRMSKDAAKTSNIKATDNFVKIIKKNYDKIKK